MRSRARGGFTLIEAIIVIVILLLVLTIALPAIHRARETSRRAQCKANLKTLGIALYNYETAYRRFPSGGKGTAWTASPSLMASPDVNPVLIPNGTAFDPQSTFTAILPYLGEFPSHKAASGDLPYNTDRETPPGRRTRAQPRSRGKVFDALRIRSATATRPATDRPTSLRQPSSISPSPFRTPAVPRRVGHGIPRHQLIAGRVTTVCSLSVELRSAW